MVKVTITSTGYLLECESGFTGHQNSIMDKLTGEQIQRIYSNSPAGTLEPVPVTTAGVIASYGMNTAVPDVLDTPGAVMVLDYHWMMAAPNDIWSDYPNPFNSGVPSFARHSGRINTVFVDGSVRSMDPYDLDPKNSHVERTYWLP
jgi:prepilin-type processing-associated H-X9-DG protein